MVDFPSNSQNKRIVREEVPKTENSKKQIDKVVEGQVVRRKKPLGRRMKETFLGGDTKSVGEFVFQDVILPAVRDMVADAGQLGLERMVYGEARSVGRRSGIRPMDPRRQHTSYDAVSRNARPRFDDRERQLSRRARANHDFGEVVIPTRPEAVAVLDGMFALLEEYDVVAVSDLYELIGASSNFTDRKWGWTDLRGSDIRRVREGYLLELPRPEVID